MKLQHTLATAIVLAIAGGLAACSDSNKTVGQKLDETVAKSESSTSEMKSDIKQGAADAKNAAGDASARAKQVVGDAAITTAVNAQLVKDASLSALKIDVDTREGHVALTGSAPNDAAKMRATQLASSVSGVASVDNQLTVK